MKWSIAYLPEAAKDLKKLDHSVRVQVLTGIEKVAQDPLPKQEGGYGKPLGNRTGSTLAGLLKIKFRALGIRVVYKLEYDDSTMKIIVISVRADEQVYREASRRRTKYKL